MSRNRSGVFSWEKVNGKSAQSRFSRQERIIGTEAQRKIQNSQVAVVGVGALGTVAANLLARAGIKELTLIDRDVVEESNLSRQMLFTEKDLNQSKAFCAKERLREINSEVNLVAKAIHLNSKNINQLSGADLIVDCTDNLKTRFLINDYCKKEKKPWIFGSAIKNQGQAMAVIPDGPCLSCFLKEANLETCEQIGVLNTITSMIGSLQADLAMKILAEKKVAAELHYIDLEKNSYQKIKVNKNKECEACNGRYRYLESKEDALYVRFCSSGKYQIEGKPVDLKELNKKLKGIVNTNYVGTALKMEKMTLFADGRALISANSEQEAQAIYSKYAGN